MRLDTMGEYYAATDQLRRLADAIEDFEAREWPPQLPDPVEAIKFRMDQQGLRQRDLIPILGSRSRVSEVLNRKRRLTLPMIRSLHRELGIALEVLSQDYTLDADDTALAKVQEATE